MSPSAWEEVRVASEENRRELVLTGKSISSRLRTTSGQLDPAIFALTSLNFLDISGASELKQIPAAIGRLVNLTTLVLNNNAIESVPGVPGIGDLSKLKVLDLSANRLESIPDEVGRLDKLQTLNVAKNNIACMPILLGSAQLAHLDVSGNALTELDFACHAQLSLLADFVAANNEIAELPASISQLTSLKKLDASGNGLTSVPGELADCQRLKELDIKDNPLADNRLKKMVAQKGTKAVLDYVRQNCPRGEAVGDGGGGGGGAGGGGKKSKKKGKQRGKEAESQANDDVEDLTDQISVLHVSTSTPRVVVDGSSCVGDVRPYIVACVARGVDLAADAALKKFLQLQTRLHETVCERRVAATIATHDAAKIPSGDIVYSAREPDDLHIVPLGQTKEVSGADLVRRLRDEAEAVRKEKKRNTVSGIHQYLNIVHRAPAYACLVDSNGRTISFPPITNADGTKMSAETKDLFIEVTSNTKLATAKMVADTLLREMLNMGLGSPTTGDGGKKSLVVEQVKVVDEEGSLKVVYPSKTDLAFSDDQIVIKRP